jgi:hypothetical protein
MRLFVLLVNVLLKLPRLFVLVSQVYGDCDNLLEKTSAVYNIGLTKLQFAIKYFGSKPF